MHQHVATQQSVTRLGTTVQVTTFGMGLVTLDCRQESSKHTEAIDTITTYLGLGSYKEWDEDKRISFLLAELTGKRPLLPPGAHPVFHLIRCKHAECAAAAHIELTRPCPHALLCYAVDVQTDRHRG